MSKLLILRGIGGNLKTSISSNNRILSKYKPVPEGNRFYSEILNNLGYTSTTAQNFALKCTLLNAFLSDDSNNYVLDRSLLDYAFFNKFVLELEGEFDDAHCPKVTEELCIETEKEYFKDYLVDNVLLLTTDRSFIQMMLGLNDARSEMYYDVDHYLAKQEEYKQLVLKYYPKTKVIELSDCTDVPKLVEKVVDRILNPQLPLTIYTDGGADGNPGLAGWAVFSPGKFEGYGYKEFATNNEMELIAMYHALEKAKGKPAHIYSDSTYVVKGLTEWHYGWQKRGWIKSDGSKVANVQLWKQLIKLYDPNLHTIEHVKGHAGNAGNERCDYLVQIAKQTKETSKWKNY